MEAIPLIDFALFGGVGEEWNVLIETPFGESRALHVGDMGSSMGSGLDAAERKTSGAGYAARWTGYISFSKDTRANTILASGWLDGGTEVSIVSATKTLKGTVGLASKKDQPLYRLVDGDDAYMGRLETKSSNGWGTVCESTVAPEHGMVSNSQVTNILNQKYGSFSNCKIVPYSNRATYMGNKNTKIYRVANALKAWTFVKNDNICDHSEDLVVDCSPTRSSRWAKDLKLFPSDSNVVLKKNVKYKLTVASFATVAPKYNNQHSKLIEMKATHGSTVSYWSAAGAYSHRLDGAVDDYKMFDVGMTAEQILNEMMAQKSEEETEAEKEDRDDL